MKIYNIEILPVEELFPKSHVCKVLFAQSHVRTCGCSGFVLQKGLDGICPNNSQNFIINFHMFYYLSNRNHTNKAIYLSDVTRSVMHYSQILTSQSSQSLFFQMKYFLAAHPSGYLIKRHGIIGHPFGAFGDPEIQRSV